MLEGMFEIDGMRFFLTWAQADPLTRQIVMNHLETIAPVGFAVVAQETHNDAEKNHHFHAIVIYKSRVKKRKNLFSIDNFICNVKRLPTISDIKRAWAYIQKEDNNFLEIGERPDYLDKMTKIEKIHYALKHTDRQCVESGQFSFSELRNIQYIRAMHIEQWPSWKKRDVTWLFGKTGCGKTRHARERLEEKYGSEKIWQSSGDLRSFFNGYKGQPGVLLDDMRPGSISFDFLLRILDGYPVDVPIKGSYIAWKAETIFITAPCQPCEMYVNRQTGECWDHLDQLLRRIDSIINMEGEEVHWSDDEQTIRQAIGY